MKIEPLTSAAEADGTTIETLYIFFSVYQSSILNQQPTPTCPPSIHVKYEFYYEIQTHLHNSWYEIENIQ